MGTESVSSDRTSTTISRDAGELEVGGGAEWMGLIDHTSTTPGLNLNVQLTQHRQASDFFWGVRADGTLFGSASLLRSPDLSADHNSQIRGARGDLSLILGTHISRTSTFNLRLFGGLGLHGGILNSPADAYLTPADITRIQETSAGGRGFTDSTTPTDTRTGQNGLFANGLTLHREGYFFGGHAIAGITAELIPAHFYLSAVGTLGGSTASVDGHNPSVDERIAIGPRLEWSALVAAGFRFGDSTPLSSSSSETTETTPPSEAQTTTSRTTRTTSRTTESAPPVAETTSLPNPEAPAGGQRPHLPTPTGGRPPEAPQAYVLPRRPEVTTTGTGLNTVITVLSDGALIQTQDRITRPRTPYTNNVRNDVFVARFNVPENVTIPQGTSLQVRIDGQNVGDPVTIPAQTAHPGDGASHLDITLPGDRLVTGGGPNVISDGPHPIGVWLNLRGGEPIQLYSWFLTVGPAYARLGLGQVQPSLRGRHTNIFIREPVIVRFHADPNMEGQDVRVVIGSYSRELPAIRVAGSDDLYFVSIPPQDVLNAHSGVLPRTDGSGRLPDHWEITNPRNTRRRYNYRPPSIRIQDPRAPEGEGSAVVDVDFSPNVFRSLGRHIAR